MLVVSLLVLAAVDPGLSETQEAAARVAAGVVAQDQSRESRARAAHSFRIYDQLPSYRAMLDREGVDGPADVAVIGSESEVERQFAEFEQAGGTDFIASLFGAAEEKQRTFEFLQTWLSHGRRAPV